MNILALNPGGNSLKADFVACHDAQRYAFEGKSRLSVSIEDIGKNPQLSIMAMALAVADEVVASAL